MGKKKPNKRKAKVKVRQSAQIVRKDSVKNENFPNIEGRPPANNGATFKVKIRKKK